MQPGFGLRAQVATVFTLVEHTLQTFAYCACNTQAGMLTVNIAVALLFYHRITVKRTDATLDSFHVTQRSAPMHTGMQTRLPRFSYKTCPQTHGHQFGHAWTHGKHGFMPT